MLQATQSVLPDSLKAAELRQSVVTIVTFLQQREGTKAMGADTSILKFKCSTEDQGKTPDQGRSLWNSCFSSGLEFLKTEP